MPFIDDVVTHTTIRSVWGNTIRDHVVAQVASVAERNAKILAPHDGQVVWTQAERVLFMYDAGLGGWAVLDMDWCAFTARAWAINLAGGSLGIVNSDCLFRNRFGACEALLSFGFSEPSVPIGPGFLWFELPVPSAKASALGTANYFANNLGTNFGGWCEWAGNSPVNAATSAALLRNAGNNQPATPAITITGPGNYVRAQLNYACPRGLYRPA